MFSNTTAAPSPKRKRGPSDPTAGLLPFAPQLEMNVALPTPDNREEALAGQDSPRTRVATQLEDLKIRGSIPPLDFGISADALGGKAKKRAKHSSSGVEGFEDIALREWSPSPVRPYPLPRHDGADEEGQRALPPPPSALLEIQETPQPVHAPRLQPAQPSRTPSPLPPPSFAKCAVIRPATPPPSLKQRPTARRKIASPPPPPPPPPPSSAPETTTATPDTALLSLSPAGLDDSPNSQTSQSSTSSSVDGGALTWQDSEITGHLVDPRLEPDDDGTGLNGIGFKPTPALAWARRQKRKQQVQEWRAREAREARRVRSERRNRGMMADGGGGKRRASEEGGRVVRFVT